MIQTIPQWTWTLISSNIYATTLHNQTPGLEFYHVTVPAGDPAPAALVRPNIPLDATELFKNPNVFANADEHVLKFQDQQDLYVFCFSKDKQNSSDGILVVKDGAGSSLPTNPSGGIDVNMQDQTTPSVEHFMYEEIQDVVIQGPVVSGQNVINLDPGHGFTNPLGFDKDYLNIHYVDTVIGGFAGVRFSQHAVVAVVGDQISITPPIGYALDPLNVEYSKRVNVNMAVIGTFGAPVTFITYPPNGLEWDITRIIVDMILTSAADDGKFGNIPALANGVHFGFEGDLFQEYQLAIFDNGSWRASAYDVNNTVRSGGAGDFGMAVRKTAAGQDKLGVAIRLQGIYNDRFIHRVQDDLTGLVRYRIKAMGHVVE